MVNMTIAVMIVYLACHEVGYLGPRQKTGVFNENGRVFVNTQKRP